MAFKNTLHNEIQNANAFLLEFSGNMQAAFDEIQKAPNRTFLYDNLITLLEERLSETTSVLQFNNKMASMNETLQIMMDKPYMRCDGTLVYMTKQSCMELTAEDIAHTLKLIDDIYLGGLFQGMNWVFFLFILKK
jgi:hypothetical protein